MKDDKTEIVLVIDRSGSMTSIKKDMEGGLKTYLENQKNQNGECFVTYYNFDGVVNRVFENLNIHNVQEIEIIPSGRTALIDAIGTSIVEVGKRLENTPEHNRPSKVIFVIITDGEENCSRQYNENHVREMIKHQKEKYNWNFMFLGANIDAVAVGRTFGIDKKNILKFAANPKGVKTICSAMSSYTSSVRSGVDFSISEKDRYEADQNFKISYENLVEKPKFVKKKKIN